MFGRSQHRREVEVTDLLQRAEALRRTDPHEAVSLQRKASELTARLFDQKHDERNAQMVGSVNYTLAAMLDAVGDQPQALAALDAAEQGYEVIYGPQAERWLADVMARRGVVLANLGTGATALLTLQTAHVRARMETSPDPAVELDEARILAGLADVQLAYGDPDLAVVAADSAVEIYQEHGSWIDRHGLGAQHQPYLLRAVVTSLVAHLAGQRFDKASLASEQLHHVTGGDIPLGVDPKEAAVRTRTVYGRRVAAGVDPAAHVTLVGALAAADAPRDLVAAMRRPISPPLAPVFRLRTPELAAQHAVAITAVLVASAHLPLEHRLRIGLEAHYLFGSATGQLRPPAHDVDGFEPVWRDLRARLADLATAHGDPALAADLAV